MLLLILSYLIITASAGCHSDEKENNDCPYEDVAVYDGPPGEIVQGKPSLPADVSFEQSAALDATLDIIGIYNVLLIITDFKFCFIAIGGECE